MLQHNTSPAGKQNHRALLLALFLALVLLISLTWIFLSASPSGESWRAEISGRRFALFHSPGRFIRPLPLYRHRRKRLYQ